MKLLGMIINFFIALVVLSSFAFGMESSTINNEESFQNAMKSEVFKKAMEDKVASYIDAALELDCWTPNGNKKVGKIIGLQQCNLKGQQQQVEKIIFLDDNNKHSLESKENLYVKISFDDGSTCVQHNLLTFVIKDLFLNEKSEAFLTIDPSSIEQLKEKPSQKTGLFYDFDYVDPKNQQVVPQENKKEEELKVQIEKSEQKERVSQFMQENNPQGIWFSKKYSETKYEYRIKHVIAHELIHFMQNKMEDFNQLKIFSKSPNEETVRTNFKFLQKYKNSFVRYINNLDEVFDDQMLVALELKNNIRNLVSIINIEDIKGKFNLQNNQDARIKKKQLTTSLTTNNITTEEIKLITYQLKQEEKSLVDNMMQKFTELKLKDNPAAIAYILNTYVPLNIKQIQTMDEKLIEEAAILGTQWGDHNINEWKILYANKLPVRYPYSERIFQAFSLTKIEKERMFQSVFGQQLSYDFKVEFPKELIVPMSEYEKKALSIKEKKLDNSVKKIE